MECFHNKIQFNQCLINKKKEFQSEKKTINIALNQLGYRFTSQERQRGAAFYAQGCRPANAPLSNATSLCADGRITEYQICFKISKINKDNERVGGACWRRPSSFFLDVWAARRARLTSHANDAPTCAGKHALSHPDGNAPMFRPPKKRKQRREKYPIMSRMPSHKSIIEPGNRAATYNNYDALNSMPWKINVVTPYMRTTLINYIQFKLTITTLRAIKNCVLCRNINKWSIDFYYKVTS